MTTSIKIRKQIEVKGIVQGVGFRPFIYKLAHNYELCGFVSNNNNGVEIEVEGDIDSINNFIESISKESPPLSLIKSVNHSDIPIQNSKTFEIKKSSETPGNKTFISPDVAVCNDCRQELFDKNDHRYFYPFINCTNCGPRFTIIENIPYDRKYTTMKNFEMCDECKAEYENPLNRRFHAQPNACPNCGPVVWFEDKSESIIEDSAIEQTVKFLLDGKIVAIKGLGGFHLAVDATNEKAVQRLRERKNREAKPFAIMVPDFETADSIAEIDDKEKGLLESIESSIVLLRKKPENVIAQNIAPDNKRLGIMLPYTPLHYIIFDELKSITPEGSLPVLVMTSANLSEEPIAIHNEEAKQRLSSIADAFLLHNRDILIRADDSVVFIINNKERLIRRSRGYVPKSFPLLKSNKSILGLGAELKNTICITKEDNAFLSQHIGDLTNLSAYKFFTETIEHMQKIMDAKAEYYAYDLHPDYLSTKWVIENNGHKSFAIQHHHAHMASCMIENKINEDVIGIILDGTGYGYDGTIWGGEILVGNYTQFERYAHLEQFPLPGGDAAAKEPWRTALSYVYNSFDKEIPSNNIFNEFNIESVLQLIDKNINSPLTSSTGRLFDAISFLAGGPDKIRYEAEAAIQLTQAVDSFEADLFEYDEPDSDKKIIPLKKLIRSVFDAVNRGETFSAVANRFHRTLTDILLKKVLSVSNERKINNIVLSGGVFQNEVLLTLLQNQLEKNGLKVYTNSKVPTNDGGISLGQVAIASKLIEQKMVSVNFIN